MLLTQKRFAADTKLLNWCGENDWRGSTTAGYLAECDGIAAYFVRADEID